VPHNTLMSKRIVLKLAVFVLCVCALFGPRVYTFFWHILHGNHISTLERKIYVPLCCIASTDGRTVNVFRLSTTLFSRPSYLAVTNLGPKPLPFKSEAEKESGYETLESAYWTYMTQNSGATSGPLRRGNGPNESFCMQTAFLPAPDKRYLRIFCYAFGGKWTAEFEGDAREVRDFYEILDNSF